MPETTVIEDLAHHAGLLENVDDAVIATDVDFRATAWNRGAERLYGWAAHEVLGRDVREFGQADLSAGQRAEARRQLLEGGRSRAELTPRRKDGTLVHVEAINVAIRNELGDVTGYLGIHRDVTDRKRAEQELREAHRRTETILESITDAFVAMDREWRYTYVNDLALSRLQAWTGKEVRREEILGKVSWELFPETVGTEVEHRLRDAMRAHGPVEFELHFAPTDEWVEVRAYPSSQGLSIYYHSITARKRAEEERENWAGQQAVVAALGLRALASDDLQPLLDEAAVLVARTLDVELVGISEALPGKDRLLLRAGVGWNAGAVGKGITAPGSLMSYTIASGEPVVSEDLPTDERFEISTLLSAQNPVSGASVLIAGRDEPFGSLGAFARHRHAFSQHNVNFMQAVANVLATAVERTQTEEMLSEVRDGERRRIARDLHDEALQELTHALAMAQGNDKASPGSDARDPLVTALKRVGEQLRGAVYDLRLEEQEGQPFVQLLEALVAHHRALALDCKIELELLDGLPGGPLGHRGTELLRILGEALTNARRHSGAQGIRVSAWQSEGMLGVEVTDDGRGFDPEGHRHGGAGFRGISERAALLDADLAIASEPGSGTQVRVEVGLNDSETGVELTRVLLVEDHAAVREGIAAMLEGQLGFELVGQAASLAEARRQLDDVDVAVVDLRLPDGYGWDLIKELRAVNPRAQVLVLTASIDRADIARAVASGAAGTLHKTAHLDEVVDAVRRLRAGETLLSPDEVLELLRFAGRERERERDDRRAIEQLTPREREVLQALADGLDSRAIADRLHITIRTQRNHVASILGKLGVHSQLQALVFAARHGVVEIR